MNIPPKEVLVRVTGKRLQQWAEQAFEQIGVPAERSTFTASRLIENDLRGVFSHGTQRIRKYIREWSQGELNKHAQTKVTRESPTTLRLDGDGGLGFEPVCHAAHAVSKKAKDLGIAAAVTGNHGHIGAAGIPSRIIQSYDLVAFVTSGVQKSLDPGKPVFSAGSGSPMSFAVPSSGSPPFVLDFGTSTPYDSNESLRKVMDIAASAVYHALGLGNICQILGGLLAGVPADRARAQRAYPAADQGSMMIAVNPDAFMPLDQFKAEVAEYIEKAMNMAPLPGNARALLSGALEWEREHDYAESGIPIGVEHDALIRSVSEEVGIEPPYDTAGTSIA